MFDTNDKKFRNVFPIQSPSLYDMYMKAFGCVWHLGELDMSNDLNDWNKLTHNEKYFISNILSFFSQSDKIVNINLDERFSVDIESLPSSIYTEVSLFYNLQKTVEDVHSQTYEMLLNKYITEPKQLKFLLNGIENIPAIKKKANWAKKWVDDKHSSFATRLIAFASLEGIFFSGSFCAIFWIKEKNILHGLTQSNEYISRDEGLHRDFACELYNILKERGEYNGEPFGCDDSTVIQIIKEAVDLEKEFIVNSFNCRLLGMNSGLMCQYIEYVADHLLGALNIEKVYNVEQPFPFMEKISMSTKTNFFEKKVTDYKKSGTSMKSLSQMEDGKNMELDDDF